MTITGASQSLCARNVVAQLCSIMNHRSISTLAHTTVAVSHSFTLFSSYRHLCTGLLMGLAGFYCLDTTKELCLLARHALAPQFAQP